MLIVQCNRICQLCQKSLPQVIQISLEKKVKMESFFLNCATQSLYIICHLNYNGLSLVSNINGKYTTINVFYTPFTFVLERKHKCSMECLSLERKHQGDFPKNVNFLCLPYEFGWKRYCLQLLYVQ